MKKKIKKYRKNESAIYFVKGENYNIPKDKTVTVINYRKYY